MIGVICGKVYLHAFGGNGGHKASREVIIVEGILVLPMLIFHLKGLCDACAEALCIICFDKFLGLAFEIIRVGHLACIGWRWR